MGTQFALKGLGKSALLSLAGSITPTGWVVIGVVVIGGVVYAKTKQKSGIDPIGGHSSGIDKKKENKHQKGDKRRKQDQGGSKARNKKLLSQEAIKERGKSNYDV